MSTTNDTPPAEAAAAPVEAPAPAPVEVAPELLWSRDEIRANAAWAILITVSLLSTFLLLRNLPSVAWPLVLAGISAYLFDPVISAMARRGLTRTAATVVIMASGAVIGVGALLAVFPMLVTQAENLPAYLRAASATIIPRIEQITGQQLPAEYDDLAKLAQDHAQDIVTNVLPTASSLAGTIASGSLSVISFLLSAAIIPVVGFYLLKGWPNVISGADDLVPPGQRPTFRARMKQLDTMLGGFIRGQLTLCTVLAILYAVGLSALGLKLGFVVGLVTGYGNLIPYVGVATGFVLAIGFTLVDFGVDWHLVGVASVYAVLLAGDGVFLTPRIVGDKVGLSPAAVIVAVLACGSLFGFAGVLLAVPSAAMLKLVLKVAVQIWRGSAVYRGA